MTKLNWEARFFLIAAENEDSINSFSSIVNVYCGTNLFYINPRPAGGGEGVEHSPYGLFADSKKIAVRSASRFSPTLYPYRR